MRYLYVNVRELARACRQNTRSRTWVLMELSLPVWFHSLYTCYTFHAGFSNLVHEAIIIDLTIIRISKQTQAKAKGF